MFRLGADEGLPPSGTHRLPRGHQQPRGPLQEVMELDPFAPSVFAFCNRRRDRVKLLFFDRSTSTETSNIKSICQTKITNLFSLRLYQQAPKY